MIPKLILEKAINSSYNKSELLRELKIPNNGRNIKKIYSLIKDYNLDTSHFDNLKRSLRIKERIVKKCPVCQKEFETFTQGKGTKTTCSHSCSNTYFRSGYDNPNRVTNYRTICFQHHEKKCILCRENKIVEVHHLDENHHNNNPENLIPLCPTHHQYWHSRFRNLIFKKVMNYVKEFKNNASVV